jgi:cellulose synthase/poly-beta-1,6-N-acetylglucosamine synthase-like glycosyltransferase
MIVVSGVLVLAGIYLSCYVAYWCILLVVHFLFSMRASTGDSQVTRFAIVIPAHNEELLLPRLLASTNDQDYPKERYATIVVADNCTDGTADAARHHGVSVLERFDQEGRGKGYAIKWALETIDLTRYDAILIVDADCFISTNALTSLDGAIQRKQIIQCYSGVGNPDDSWFTRLLDVSRTINNDIYSPAKQRLGLSCQLIGTGMCFTTRILKTYGWDALTIGEDCEYYAKLIQNGETIGFDWDAKVYHQESSSLKQATTQRMRWSSGRFAVAWKHGFSLLRRGMIERNVIKFDAGLTLILPNPSLGINVTLVCLAVALLTSTGNGVALPAWFFLLAAAQLGVFVVGVFYTEKKLSKFLAIFIAPAFLAWKMGIDALAILGVGRKKWIRTERKL